MAQKVINWAPEERLKAGNIASDLLACRVTPKSSVGAKALYLSAANGPGLLSGVRDTTVGPRENFLPVRDIYRLLQFPECEPFRWHLEHKLIQALILNYFRPGTTPETVGLQQYLSSTGHAARSEVRETLRTAFVKPSLGSCGSQTDQESTDRALELANNAPRVAPFLLFDEQLIVQTRLHIAEEFRVHTVEDEVVPDLTYARHSRRGLAPSALRSVNHFVASVLTALPPAFAANSICGWDIAQTVSGEMFVVEVNFGGFHPTVDRGFQCSGFLVDRAWGSHLVARLLRFVERKYSVEIAFDESSAGEPQIDEWYRLIRTWRAALRLADSLVEFGALVRAQTSTEATHTLQAAPARRLFAEYQNHIERSAILMAPLATPERHGGL